MNLKEKNIWVVGAGFLGSALAGACRQSGARVLTLDKKGPADVLGDVAEGNVVSHAVSLGEPAVVFCCMSTKGGSAEDYERTYLQGVKALRRAAPEARMVFCSSVSVYGGQAGQVVTEESPLCSVSPRSRALALAESEAMEAGGVAGRLAALYGEGRCELLRRHLAGEPRLPGGGGRCLNYLHVSDAVRALMMLASMDDLPYRLFNICSESFSLGQAYALLERLTGVSASSSSAKPVLRGRFNQMVSCKRLWELGWRPQMRFADFARSQLA